MPVHNEDVAAVYGRIAQMAEAIAQGGMAKHFDFFILSDSAPEAEAEEVAAWRALAQQLDDLQAHGRREGHEHPDDPGDPVRSGDPEYGVIGQRRGGHGVIGGVLGDIKAAEWQRLVDSNAIEKLGLLTDLRAREFYEKPTAERKRKKAAAVKRHYKRVRSMQLPKKLY